MINTIKQIHSHFNYNRAKTIGKKNYRIPIINNMGLLNLQVTADWFVDMVQALHLSPDALFVDVGVNVGQTLLKYRSLSEGRYLGFEPNPACVFYLQQLIGLNKINKAQVMPCGLSTSAGMLKFYQKNISDSAGTMVSGLRPGFYEEERVNYVPVFAFDELEIENKSAIGFVKIDVEGAELEVLSGMKKTLEQYKPAVICEILDAHSDDSLAPMQARATKLMALMKSVNYQVYRIRLKNGRTECEEVQEIKLRKWSPESFDQNDYLLAPRDKAAGVVERIRVRK